MKCIGRVRDARDEWSAFQHDVNIAMTSALYIAEPPMSDVGPKEFERIGWILPNDAEAQGGGKIYKTREHAGRNGMPCYIKREIELPTAPAERSPMDDARERITALEKAFVMLTSQSADVIEAQRKSIERLSAQIKEVHAYAGSLERAMRMDTSATEIMLRREVSLAALSGLCARWGDSNPKNTVKAAYRVADAFIAADAEPTSDQAHTG